MMVLIRLWRSLTKKEKRVLNMKYNFFLLLLQFYDVFFVDPDFSGSDPDF